MAITLCVQAYWNYKNYEVNKRNFSAEVQQSLDNALDGYYKQLTKRNRFSIIATDRRTTDGSLSVDKDLVKQMKSHGLPVDSILKLGSPFETKEWKNLSTVKPDSIKSITITRNFVKSEQADSALYFRGLPSQPGQGMSLTGQVKTNDPVKGTNVTSIFISFQEDTINFEQLDTLMRAEFKRRDFEIPYSLTFKKKDTVFATFHPEVVQKNFLSVQSKSTFLKEGESLDIIFPNATWIILRYSLWGILVSFFLALVIMGALLYLLQTIRQQKQLSEIKDDFISNITHEFKTPIANINAALEGMSSFNVLDDRAKTQRYVGMSHRQLEKLTLMVEKILETATLETSDVQLKVDSVDIVPLLGNMVSTYTVNNPAKKFKLNIKQETAIVPADRFHLENALNNVLDNAVKYGGERINVTMQVANNVLTLLIADNGGNLTKEQAGRVFEKFYRVPKGNVHDVKGFGIGLYYTKNIIEKHGGRIEVHIHNALTVFEITLPYGS